MLPVRVRLPVLLTLVALGCAPAPATNAGSGVHARSLPSGKADGAPSGRQVGLVHIAGEEVQATQARARAAGALPGHRIVSARELVRSLRSSPQPGDGEVAAARGELAPALAVPVIVGGGLVLLTTTETGRQIGLMEVGDERSDPLRVSVEAGRGVLQSIGQAWGRLADPSEAVAPAGPGAGALFPVVLGMVQRALQQTREDDAVDADVEQCEAAAATCESLARVPESIDGSRPVGTPAVGGHVRIGTWNIERLGWGDCPDVETRPGSRGERRDWQAIARIIDDNLDVVTIVELMNSPRWPAQPPCGFRRLEQALGPRWTGVSTEEPRPNPSDRKTRKEAEYYAIFYRESAVRLCEGWDGLRRVSGPPGDADSEQSGGDARGDFLREPAFGCFRAGEFDFLLADYHGTTNGASAEVGHMGRVFAEMRAAAAPEEDDFLVAGDFNLTFGQLTANLDFGTPLSRPGAQKGSMVKREEDAVGSRMLDHLVVADPCASRELERQQRVLDVWVGLGGARAYYDTVSDHLPVMAYARTGRDEDGCD